MDVRARWLLAGAATIAAGALSLPAPAEGQGEEARAAASKPVTACVGRKGAARFLRRPGRCRRGERRMNLLTAPADPGPKGEVGAAGGTGATGAAGATASGSPDSPAQVLQKLAEVDGAGSGLDAGTLAGVDAGGFQRRGTTTA